MASHHPWQRSAIFLVVALVASVAHAQPEGYPPSLTLTMQNTRIPTTPTAVDNTPTGGTFVWTLTWDSSSDSYRGNSNQVTLSNDDNDFGVYWAGPDLNPVGTHWVLALWMGHWHDNPGSPHWYTDPRYRWNSNASIPFDGPFPYAIDKGNWGAWLVTISFIPEEGDPEDDGDDPEDDGDDPEEKPDDPSEEDPDTPDEPDTDLPETGIDCIDDFLEALEGRFDEHPFLESIRSLTTETRQDDYVLTFTIPIPFADNDWDFEIPLVPRLGDPLGAAADTLRKWIRLLIQFIVAIWIAVKIFNISWRL